jgi:hypothetical protein
MSQFTVALSGAIVEDGKCVCVWDVELSGKELSVRNLAGTSLFERLSSSRRAERQRPG